MADTAGSAAAPAASSRNCRRGSFIAFPPSRSYLIRSPRRLLSATRTLVQLFVESSSRSSFRFQTGCQESREVWGAERPKLFDDVVGDGQQGVGDRHAERPCGLEIDDELEFRRLLHRNIRRLSPFQDLVDELGGAPVQLPAIGSV